METGAQLHQFHVHYNIYDTDKEDVLRGQILRRFPSVKNGDLILVISMETEAELHRLFIYLNGLINVLQSPFSNDNAIVFIPYFVKGQFPAGYWLPYMSDYHMLTDKGVMHISRDQPVTRVVWSKSSDPIEYLIQFLSLGYPQIEARNFAEGKQDFDWKNEEVKYLIDVIHEYLNSVEISPKGSEISDILKSTEMYYYRDLFLFPSGRTRTTMSFIGNKETVTDTKVYYILRSRDPTKLPDEYQKKTFEMNQWILVPVARYASRKGGFYFSSDSSDDEELIEEDGEIVGEPLFCGTFYYYEPNSTNYLRARKILISPNKMTASYFLCEDENMVGDMMEKNMIGVRNEDLQLFWDFFNKYSLSGYSDLVLAMMSGSYDVLKHESFLYSQEDVLDQFLCVKSIEKGYDLVILTSMTGTERQVTEVLDVRDRNASYGNVVTIQGE